MDKKLEGLLDLYFAVYVQNDEIPEEIRNSVKHSSAFKEAYDVLKAKQATHSGIRLESTDNYLTLLKAATDELNSIPEDEVTPVIATIKRHLNDLYGRYVHEEESEDDDLFQKKQDSVAKKVSNMILELKGAQEYLVSIIPESTFRGSTYISLEAKLFEEYVRKGRSIDKYISAISNLEFLKFNASCQEFRESLQKEEDKYENYIMTYEDFVASIEEEEDEDIPKVYN